VAHDFGRLLAGGQDVLHAGDARGDGVRGGREDHGAGGLEDLRAARVVALQGQVAGGSRDPGHLRDGRPAQCARDHGGDDLGTDVDGRVAAHHEVDVADVLDHVGEHQAERDGVRAGQGVVRHQHQLVETAAEGRLLGHGAGDLLVAHADPDEFGAGGVRELSGQLDRDRVVLRDAVLRAAPVDGAVGGDAGVLRVGCPLVDNDDLHALFLLDKDRRRLGSGS